jgi:hypothetical protein
MLVKKLILFVTLPLTLQTMNLQAAEIKAKDFAASTTKLIDKKLKKQLLGAP